MFCVCVQYDAVAEAACRGSDEVRQEQNLAWSKWN